MRDFTFSIAAGDTYSLREKGSYFLVKSTTAPVSVTTDNQRVRLNSINDGQGFKNVPFKEVVITAATAVTITVIVAEAAEVIEAVQIVGSVGISGSSTLTPSNKTVGTGATTIAAVTGQKKITLKAKASNTADITIGTTAGTGISLAAGEGITIDTAAAVPLISTAASQVLEVLQES